MKNFMKVSLVGLISLVACATPNPASEQPSNLERRVLGVVDVDFSIDNGIVTAKTKFNPSPAIQLQTGPPVTSYTAITVDRAFTGRIDYSPTRQRFISSNFRVTNKTNAAFSNLTLYGVERTASIGNTALSGLAREDGSAVPNVVDVSRTMKPNHGMRINTSSLSLEVDPDKADFQAISNTDASSIATANPAFLSSFNILNVLSYGFSARNFNTSGNRRAIAANGGQGQVTIALNYPLATNTFDNPSRWSWSFLVVDEPTTRVTRSLEEGISTTPVANRALATGITPTSVVLMARNPTPLPNTVVDSVPSAPYNTIKLGYTDVKTASFPTYISEDFVIWVQANASPGGNGSSGLPFQTIQEGVNAADIAGGDVIRVRNGTYSGAVTIDRSVQIYGPVSSTDGRDPSRCVTGPCATDANITGLVQVTATAPVTIAGFRFFDNSPQGVAASVFLLDVTTVQNHLIENNVFYRDGTTVAETSPGSGVYAFVGGGSPNKQVGAIRTAEDNTVSTKEIVIQKNRISGNPVNASGYYANKSWGASVAPAVSIGGGTGGKLDFKDNTIDSARAAMYINKPNANHKVTNNVFKDNATGFGLATVSITSLSITGNTFSTTSNVPTPPANRQLDRKEATYFNLRNAVPNTFTLTASNNTYDGNLPSAMTNTQLFDLEDQTDHRIDSAGWGLVRFKPTSLYFTPQSCSTDPVCAAGIADPQRAIDAANSGDTIYIETGTYNNQLSIAKNLTVVGEGAGTIIQAPVGLALALNGGAANNANLVDINGAITVSLDMIKVQGPHTRAVGACNASMKLNRGISISGGAGVTITNSYVDSIRDTALFNCVNQGVGIQVAASSSLNLSSSEITNFQSNGILVTGASSTAIIDNNLIQGNTTNPVTSRGIEIAAGGATTISNNIIQNALCPTCTGQDLGIGVLVRTNSLVTITGNTIANNDLGVNARGSGLNLVISNNAVNANLSAGARFFSNGGLFDVPASGNVTFNSNTIVGPTIPGTSVCFGAETNALAAASLVVTGTGNKISKCNFALDLKDTVTLDLNTINLSLQSGNIDGVIRDMVNVGVPAPDLVNNWWVTIVGPLPANIPTLIGAANTTPVAVAPF